LVAHYLKTGWGKRNNTYLEVNSCSKEDITVPSVLAPHTTHTTTEANALILKRNSNHLRKSVAIRTVIIGCVL
jgi:hypothetical protein